MKNYSLLILLLSQVVFSQVSISSFDKGLMDGWNETLREANNIDIFKAGSPDSNKCSMIPNYAPNDNKKETKEYSRGYRCGVEQAGKKISILQRQMQNGLQSQISNSEFYIVDNSNFTSYEAEMSLLKRKMLQESEKYNNLPDSQRSAQLSKLNADYTNIENKLRQKYSGYQQNLGQSNYNNQAQINNNTQGQLINNNIMSVYDNQKQAQMNLFNSMMEEQNNQVAVSANNSQTQLDLQKNYDINVGNIKNAINDINQKITNLNYPEIIKSEIKKDFGLYVDDINNYFTKNKNDILNNTIVTNTINYLYQSIDNSIKNRVQEYNDQILSDIEKNKEFALNFNNGYKILSEDDDLVKEINSNRADKKKYDELIKKREVMFQNALPYFEKAFQLNPNDENTKAILKMTYELLGQPEKIKTLE
jgi:hypothetical protein